MLDTFAPQHVSSLLLRLDASANGMFEGSFSVCRSEQAAVDAAAMQTIRCV